MSIDAMRAVWTHSRQSGTALNAMLALADAANADGYCWPSVATLAALCRCSSRQMQRIIADLEGTGELYAERGQGRTNTTRYLITLETTIDEMSTRLVKYFGYKPTEAVAEATAHLEKGDIQREKVTPTSPIGEMEKGDIQREKVTSGAEKVTSSAGKGDIAMSPEPIEPPIEPEYAPRRACATPAAALPQLAKVKNPESAYPDVVKIYEHEIGLLTPIISGEIKEALRLYPATWLTEAIAIAVRRNNRRWSYAAGVLRRWARDGYDGGQDNLSAQPRTATPSKSLGYGRQATPAKEHQPDEYANDPEYLKFLASFVDAADAARSAAD